MDFIAFWNFEIKLTYLLTYIIGSSPTGKNMRPADPALGILRNSASPRTLNLLQVVAGVFHFRIVNTPPASISIHFRKFSAQQLSEIRIVKRDFRLKTEPFSEGR